MCGSCCSLESASRTTPSRTPASSVNYAYQTPSSTTLFFEDKVFNQFMAAGGMGVTIDEFNGDNFDHAGLGFIGGGFFQASTSGSRPLEVRPGPRGTPRWGAGGEHAGA